MSVLSFAVVAHQGGWDEILLVGGPILVIGGALWIAKRRVEASVAGAGERSDRTEPVDHVGPDDDSLVE